MFSLEYVGTITFSKITEGIHAKPHNQLDQRPHPNLRSPQRTRTTHGRLTRQQTRRLRWYRSQTVPLRTGT